MFYGFILIIAGLLASPSLFLSKKPNAKEYLDKLVPYQGWFGIVLLVWGIFGIFHTIGMISWLSIGMWGVIAFILQLACTIIELGIGALLGYGIVFQYVLKSPEQKAKGEQVLAKIRPYTNLLAMSAIVVGILYTIVMIIM